MTSPLSKPVLRKTNGPNPITFQVKQLRSQAKGAGLKCHKKKKKKHLKKPEKMIVCIAVVGHQNNPLYLQSFTEADDALKLHHIVHCSLDVIDERVNNPKKTSPTLNETFLGLLYPTENYKVYGYLTNTKVKFILVTTDLDVRDADVRNFFRRFHSAYVDAVSNPFHVPGKKITSRIFAERVSSIVKSFGFSTAV
ncbi:hypothetical protein IFM89_001898 [Coptis chinensis]|uniref:Trafficking protein particle complex subunit n=1 Tax=Coptis chinensis TaxID=261450 RepID=A0A835ILK5_9MAGN|nr:hypothetical protein IFM89_001898 [Coptis chinensis]